MQVKIFVRQFEKFIQLSLLFLFLSTVLVSCTLHQSRQDGAQKFNSPDVVALRSIDEPLSPAISQLISQADALIDRKDWVKAMTQLERALRINKRQAEIWTRMAVVHQGQNEYGQSLQMAKRSNSYAAQNNKLKSYNWRLISQAYLKLNKPDQSQLAAQKSQQLQEQY